MIEMSLFLVLSNAFPLTPSLPPALLGGVARDL